jgi:hypothetical protein
MTIIAMLILIITTSCSFFNKDKVAIKINSNPSGANIIINGQNYGTTPAQINIEPKDHQISIIKDNYNPSTIKLETWVGIRKDRNDGIRCFADAFGSFLVIPAISFFSGKCLDFKKHEYNVNLTPNIGNYGYGNNIKDLPPNNNQEIQQYQEQQRYYNSQQHQQIQNYQW